MESSKDKSAIVQIDTSALIEKVQRRLRRQRASFIGFKSQEGAREGGGGCGKRGGQQASVRNPSLGVSDLRSV